MGSQVVSAGLDNVSWLSWNEGSVWVADESSVSSGVDWGNWGDWQTLGGEVLGLGSNLGWGVSWDNGAVGVGHQRLGVWVGVWGIGTMGITVAITVAIETMGIGTSVVTVWVGTIGVWQSIGTLGGEVSSLSSLDLWGLGWSNGTVGVGDELGAGDGSRGEESLKSPDFVKVLNRSSKDFFVLMVLFHKSVF